MWTFTSVGLCLFVINFAYHGIVFNNNDKDKIYTDTVLINTIQIFSSMLTHVIMVEEMSWLKFGLYGIGVLFMGWCGFAFDYYLVEYNLIKYYWRFSNTTLAFCIFCLMMLLVNNVMTLEVVYFIIVGVMIHYASNGFLDHHISQKITMTYP